MLGLVGLVFVAALLFVKEPRDARRDAGAAAVAVPPQYLRAQPRLFPGLLVKGGGTALS